MLPYFTVCAKYKGLWWKGLAMYGIYVTINAIYDVGMYARFFLLGPGYLRSLCELDQEDNFSALQVRLFMKSCAATEIKKATGDQ